MSELNYKTISVVAVNNLAIAMNKENKYIKKFGDSNTVASLKALKSILSTSVKDNSDLSDEPVRVILGAKSSIKGFAIGSYVEYLRTGANSSGKAFTQEEMDLIVEVSNLYASKCLNVRITTDEFISHKDKDTRILIDNSWKQLKALSQQLIAEQNKANQLKEEKAKQDNEVNNTIATLSKEVTKAVLSGDIELATKLSEMIANLNNSTKELDNVLEDTTNNEEEPKAKNAGKSKRKNKGKNKKNDKEVAEQPEETQEQPEVNPNLEGADNIVM